MSTAAENAIRDALSVSPAGLTQTQLINFVNNAKHRVDGKKYQGPTIKRLIAAMDDVTSNDRYVLDDSERWARALWAEERLVEVLVDVDKVETYRSFNAPYDSLYSPKMTTSSAN